MGKRTLYGLGGTDAMRVRLGEGGTCWGCFSREAPRRASLAILYDDGHGETIGLGICHECYEVHYASMMLHAQEMAERERAEL